VNDYARRLARYISDASTVRVRTLETYGRAPTVEQIRTWRGAWVAEKEWRREARMYDEAAEEAELSSAISRQLTAGEAAPPEPANDVDVASPPVQRIFPAEGRAPLLTYTDVLSECARFTGVSVEDMIGTTRKYPIVRARQFTATVLRARGNSYPCIGRFMGNRDHSTMIHAVDTFFDVGLRDPLYVRGWTAYAPCLAKAARSRAELDLLMVARP
jgi:chromosomal replication initiator protein